AAGTLPADAAVYAIANYTALPQVHAALNAMEAAEPALAPAPTPAPIAEAAGASAAPIYAGMAVFVDKQKEMDRDEVIHELIDIQYDRNDYEQKRGTY
ncbi:hypothetical protein NE591_15135, partial [Adlercreutzia sp. DFI.6.23]|nr:hypothetical protein [Adlercreutzia sp. DFI.6.23]